MSGPVSIPAVQGWEHGGSDMHNGPRDNGDER